MDKTTTIGHVMDKIKDGGTLLVGGFLSTGSPETLIAAIIEKSQAGNFTVVSNDTGTGQTNMIKLMSQGRVKKVMASYIGLNAVAGQMLLDNPQSVELIPQGTLAERIRAGGAGIPAFYSPVGVGTIVEEGKEKREIDGIPHLLEFAIKGDVALIKATVADKHGNCFMKGTTKNFNAIMPQAAKYVIAEAEQIVEVGELDPEDVTVPGIFVDAVIQSEE